MRLILALALGISAFGHREEVHAADLPIAEAIEGNAVDVVLLGWGHFFGNAIIPNILIQELASLTAEAASRTVLIVEWPHGAPEALFDLPMAQRSDLAHLKRVMAAARAKGLKVISGDHQDRLTQEVDIRLRDACLANAVVSEVREGRKAVVWVGSSHCWGIARKLRSGEVSFQTVMTTYNPFTGEVRWGDKRLPTGGPDPVMISRFPAAKASDGWIAIKSPELDYLNIVLNKIRKACAAFLGA